MSGGPAENRHSSRFAASANRLGNLIRTGSIARAILRRIAPTGRYADAARLRDAGSVEKTFECQAAAMQLAARLAEASAFREACERTSSDRLDDFALCHAGESLRQRANTTLIHRCGGRR